MRARVSPRTGRLYLPALLSGLLFAGAAHACLGVERTITLDGDRSFYGVGNGGNMGLRHKEVVLTFDDGPSPYTTSKILRTLRKHCTKATFFVVGSMARAYPSTLRNVARAGHTIAHHSYSHSNLARKNITSSARDIERGFNAVRRALGPDAKRSSHLFRYPYLSRNARLDAVLNTQGLVPVSASIMSQDWKPGSGADVVARIMRQLNRQKRGVVLMHDIQHRTANALPILLKRLEREGYKIVHIKGRRAPERLRDAAPLIAQLGSPGSKVPRKRITIASRLAHLRDGHRSNDSIVVAKSEPLIPEQIDAPSIDIAALLPAEDLVSEVRAPVGDGEATDPIVTGTTLAWLEEPKTLAKSVSSKVSSTNETEKEQSSKLALARPEPSRKPLSEAVTKREAPLPTVAVPLEATRDEFDIAMVTALPWNGKPVDETFAPTTLPAASVVAVDTERGPAAKPGPSTVVIAKSAPTAATVADKVSVEETTIALAKIEPDDVAREPSGSMENTDSNTVSKAVAERSPLRRWFQRRSRKTKHPAPKQIKQQVALADETQREKKVAPISAPDHATQIPEVAGKADKSPLRRWFQRRRAERQRARAEREARSKAKPEQVSRLSSDGQADGHYSEPTQTN